MTDTRPRAIRDNNPGNLRPLAKGTWQGQAGVDSAGDMGNYCTFVDPEHGIRAIVKVLQTYQLVDGCDTVRKVFARWAPGGDHNDPDGYAAFVAKAMLLEPDDVVRFTDADFFDAAKAIIRMESGTNSGTDWYPDSVIQAGINLALGIHKVAA